ncbi:hypothetical protein AK812_SmicGene5954 [Symbiodinium microadriaticum]|uniref:Uncharacterized protein n=1 Tax=Symbiodinium microadriaticum TaxID=2951 RepID=A0A1Q9ESF5_SYMMI|nr:hypothetical protein AK812_SmicGene5954 [Symbiodinium microadriaticum]
MPTISVMSDEAPGSEDGGRISTVTGALQGNSAVPDLNALTSAAPSLEGIFYPANISPFVAACTLDVTKNITRFTNSTFRAYAQQQAFIASKEIQHMEAQAEKFTRTGYIGGMLPKYESGLGVVYSDESKNRDFVPPGPVFWDFVKTDSSWRSIDVSTYTRVLKALFKDIPVPMS